MADEKTKRERTPRSEKEQAFMDAVHNWRKNSYPEAWLEVEAAALEYKKDKIKTKFPDRDVSGIVLK